MQPLGVLRGSNGGHGGHQLTGHQLTGRCARKAAGSLAGGWPHVRHAAGGTGRQPPSAILAGGGSQPKVPAFFFQRNSKNNKNKTNKNTGIKICTVGSALGTTRGKNTSYKNQNPNQQNMKNQGWKMVKRNLKNTPKYSKKHETARKRNSVP